MISTTGIYGTCSNDGILLAIAIAIDNYPGQIPNIHIHRAIRHVQEHN